MRRPNSLTSSKSRVNETVIGDGRTVPFTPSTVVSLLSVLRELGRTVSVAPRSVRHVNSQTMNEMTTRSRMGTSLVTDLSSRNTGPVQFPH